MLENVKIKTKLVVGIVAGFLLASLIPIWIVSYEAAKPQASEERLSLVGIPDPSHEPGLWTGEDHLLDRRCRL